MSTCIADHIPNTRVSPPGVPAALGTDLYPESCIQERGGMPVETFMKEQALVRLRREMNTFYNRKHQDFVLFREDNCRSFRYCSICSEHVRQEEPYMRRIEHTHYSSLKQRIDSRTDRWGQFLCTTCRDGVHSVRSGIRYPILVTSSTLALWQGRRYENNYPGDPIHVDTIAIPGARVRDLEHAFSAEYAALPRPSDVLLCAGIYNLLKDQQTVEQIMSEINSFKKVVLRNPQSSFAVTTLPMPPCMSRLRLDNYQLPRRNMKDDLIELNRRIRELNATGDQCMQVYRAPLFHTYGLAGQKTPPPIGPRRILETMPNHALHEWREDCPRDQLHLNEKVRLRMGRVVVKYFQKIYGMLE